MNAKEICFTMDLKLKSQAASVCWRTIALCFILEDIAS